LSQLRIEKVQELMKQEISQIILQELKDPRIGFVTVTKVEMTGDLREAKIFVSIMGKDEALKDTLQGLKSSLGFIRREIGKRIRLRHLARIHLLFLGERLAHDAVGHVELIRRRLGLAVCVNKTVLCIVGTSAESGFVILYLALAFLHFLASQRNPYDNI